jgi:hypothetical protein
MSVVRLSMSPPIVSSEGPDGGVAGGTAVGGAAAGGWTTGGAGAATGLCGAWHPTINNTVKSAKRYLIIVITSDRAVIRMFK